MQDLAIAKNMPGFTRESQLQTDLLFFNNKMAPFDKPAVRQAFAYATDKATLVNAIFKGAAGAPPTVIPPGMPGYHGGYQGPPYDKNKALASLVSPYPDVSQAPS